MTEPAPSLYDDVQARIASARERVEALDVSQDVRRAAVRRLDRFDRASTHDLSLTSREVASFVAELDAGELPLFD